MCSKDLIRLFREQVEKYPERIALKFQEKEYSYRELDKITDQFASNLLAKVNRQSVIGIYMERTDRYIIAILGILKSGCTYLPISKLYPSERIKNVLTLSTCNTVIVEHGNIDIIRNLSVNTLNFENLLSFNESTDGLRNFHRDRDWITYIIFTSGSTGKPKGIAIRDRSVMNLIQAMDEKFEKRLAGNNFALLAEFVFDMSVGQLFYALFTGNTLDVIQDETKLSCEKLRDFFIRRNIHCCDITPTRLALQLDYYDSNKDNVAFPRYFVSSGEPLPLSMVRRLYTCKGSSETSILNCYGPTETCVYCSCYEINKDNAFIIDRMLVGKPLRNMQVYVLKEDFTPCDAGVTGEIYIGGEGVAVGYVNQPELTEVSFIPNPFDPSATLYKSGDLGRWTKDGELECLGRKDDQIKFHGYRIELSEIEAIAESLEGVTRAKAIVVKEENQEIMVLYFTSSRLISLNQMQEHMRKNLPYYMIPSYYVPVQVFQYNINGKLDKKALPDYKTYALATTVDNMHETLYEIDDSISKDLLSICSKVLNKENIKLSDNFIRIGGDSLIIFQLNTFIQEKWGIMIDIADIFESKNLGKIAEMIRNKLNNPHEAENAKYEGITNRSKDDKKDKDDIDHTNDNKDHMYYWDQKKHKDPIVLYANSFQEAILKAEQDSMNRNQMFHTSKYPTYNMIYLLKSDRYIEPTKLQAALKHIVQRHDMLRATFHKEEKRHRISIHKECDPYFEYISYQGNLDTIAYERYIRTFSSSTLPLFQIALFENGEGQQCVLLNFYHIIFDYISIRIFLNELFALYHQQNLPKPMISAYDYFLAAQQSKNEENSKFWQDYLKDRQPAIVFTPDKTYDTLQPTSDDRFLKKTFTIDKDRLARIRALCQKEGITEYIFFSSVLAILLYYKEGKQDMIIGSNFIGRDQLAMDAHIIGLLTKLIPFRIKIDTKDRVIDFLKKQKSNFASIMTHQGIDIGKLYRYMTLSDLMKGPLFYVSFNILSDYSITLPFDNRHIEAMDLSENPDILPFSITGKTKTDSFELEFMYLEKLYSNSMMNELIDLYLNIIDHFTCYEMNTIEDIITSPKLLFP